MRFGASPQELSLLTAQAAVAADAMYNQSGDPMDRLVLVQSPDGYWSTQTVRNQQFLNQSYSQRKTMLEYVGYGAAGLGVVWVLSKLFKR